MIELFSMPSKKWTLSRSTPACGVSLGPAVIRSGDLLRMALESRWNC